MKPDEKTLRDVMHEAVACTLESIHSLQEILEAHDDTNVNHAMPLSWSNPNTTASIWVYHPHSAYDRQRPCIDRWGIELGWGFTSCYLQLRTFVVRHRAVLNALKDSLGIEFHCPKELIIDEYPEDWTYTIGHVADSNRHNDPGFIAQLCTHNFGLMLDHPPRHGEAGHYGITQAMWRAREDARLRTGDYTPLPQAFLDLLPKEVIENQFPHLAVKPGNMGMVAYTQSPVAGALDRQQVQKPGRYIRMHRPDLTDEQVKQAAALVLGSLKADFHHTKDPDEIARVYMEGPQSCMTAEGRFDHLEVDGKPYHPAMIYGHPENNIELVYLEVNGRIGARALVNTAKKQYPRIYASDSVAGALRRMQMYLSSLGYELDDHALAHEKLLRVAPDAAPEAIICPYIDNGNLGVEVYDDHLLVYGDCEANYETGCLHDYDMAAYTWSCWNCDSGQTDEDDSFTDENGERICHECAEDATEAYCLDDHRWVYVYNEYDTYDISRTRCADDFWGETPLGYIGHHSPSYFGLVELTTDFYAERTLADSCDAIEYVNGDYVLIEDLDQFDLVDVDGEAHHTEDCYVLDGVVHTDGDFPEHCERIAPLAIAISSISPTT